MLRLPSEALPIHRALTDERLLSDDPPSSAAVIGRMELKGHQRLIIRLNRQKNDRNGFTAMRPCFCDTTSYA